MSSIHSKTSRQRSMDKFPKIIPRPTATSIARANMVPGGGGKGSPSPVRSRSITSSRRISASSNPKVQTSLAETRRAPSSPECNQEKKPIPSSFILPPATDNENIEDNAGVKGSELNTDDIQKESDAGEQVMQVHSPDIWELNDLKITDNAKDQISTDTLNNEKSDETIMPPQSDDILEEQKKMINQLKEDVELKQKMIQGLCSSSQASERGQECGASEGSTATSTAGWSNDLHGTSTCEPENARTADAYLTTLRFRLGEVTACMADMCQQALTNRELVIDWIFDNLDHDEEDSDNSKLEKLKKFKNEGVSLLDMLEEMKTKAECDVEDAIQLSKQAWSEREAQFAIGETLLGDVMRLRSQIKDLQKHIDEAEKQPTLPAPQPNEDVEKLSHELSEERSGAAVLRKRLAAAETQLCTAKQRIAKLDKQLKETESSLMSLTNTVKTGDDQKRQRDLLIDSRVRKARDALKTSEVTVRQLTQQKETLEKRIAELMENMQTSSERHSGNTATLRGEVASLKDSLASQTRAAEQEAAQRILAEEALTSASANIHKLQADIESLQQRLPNPDAPTEREIVAWGEAQAAQEALRLLENELSAARREKKHFLETLANITDSGTEVNIQQKLAAELLSKDDIVSNLQDQMHDLTKSCKLNEYKLEQYELHLRDLQLYRAAVTAASGSDSSQQLDQIDCRDPQQEIINLRMSLVELVHRNEELMEELRIKESALEQQERSARAQKNVIKAREGLIEMLQKKETAQSEELANTREDLAQRMQVVDEVSKQIAAKAEEIQELFSSLDHKQQEIQRREKIIRTLEEQLRRAQAQRTKLEEKISTLEHELDESGARRRGQEKKFIFF